MKNPKIKIQIVALSILILAFFIPVASAKIRALNTSQPNTPELDPNSSKFKIVVCDGPKLPPKLLAQEPNGGQDYVVCDFNGLMLQVQHLINIMMVIGIVVSIFAFSWAGALYISGSPAKKQEAHTIFPKVFKGLIIMLSAWFIVYQILSWLTKNEGLKTLLGS